MSAMSTTIGAVEVDSLLDGVGKLAPLESVYPEVPLEQWEPYRSLYPELFTGDGWRLPCACHLLRSNGTTILVDTGVGPPGLWTHWEPEAEGRLPALLAESGLSPADVDVVFLTHLHVDHVGWNTNVGGEIFFPAARYVVHADAVARVLSVPERPHIRRCVAPLVGRFEEVRGTVELTPEISAFETPGHYPGHMSLRISSDGADAVVLGDVVPHPAVLDRPEWEFSFDTDAPTTTVTRHALLPELVDRDVAVVCGHYPGNGVGRVVSRDGRTVFEPA